MDIDSIKNIIKKFAEEYHFIQDTDIEKVENTIFHIRNYDILSGKKCISIEEYRDKNKNRIVLGKIFITVDKDDEGDEEYYGIDKEIFSSFHIVDFLSEETLMKAIKTECKKYNLI